MAKDITTTKRRGRWEYTPDGNGVADGGEYSCEFPKLDLTFYYLPYGHAFVVFNHDTDEEECLCNWSEHPTVAELNAEVKAFLGVPKKRKPSQRAQDKAIIAALKGSGVSFAAFERFLKRTGNLQRYGRVSDRRDLWRSV